MARNPNNRRVEILLSPEQYEALKEYAQYEYLGDTEANAKNADIAAAIRQILAWAIPTFERAKPLVARGKYERGNRG